MNLKLGDKVRFVNENMEGYVTSIRDSKTVGVTIEDDFEIPVLIGELIQIQDSYSSTQNNVRTTEKKEQTPIATNHALGIYLAFERISESQLKAYLFNNISEQIQLAYYQKENNIHVFQSAFLIERQEVISLNKTFELNHIEEWRDWYFMMHLLPERSVELPVSIVKSFKLNGAEFHKSFRYVSFLQKQGYLFRLDEGKILQQKINEFQKQGFANESDNTSLDKAHKIEVTNDAVIDLHIDKIPKQWRQREFKITIDEQIYIASKCLESAHQKGLKQITFIHGVGTQLLKNKLKALFKEHAQIILKFEDASALLYGGGAMVVYIK